MTYDTSQQRIAILITGPPGIGKSTAAIALCGLLNKNGTPNAFIDTDYLRWYAPRPADDPFGERIGRKHLAYLTSTYDEIGIEVLVIADIVESQRGHRILAECVVPYALTVVRLTADIETVDARLRGRQTEEELPWFLNRARVLAAKMDAERIGDALVDTNDQTPTEISSRILALINQIATSDN